MAFAGGAAAAAAHRRRKMEEEEETVGYSEADLTDDWEFKIVRSVMGRFDDPAVFRSVVQEESRAGWQLLEKFDDNRIRFKRPRAAREQDGYLPSGVDPYRTRYGISELRFAALLITGMFVVIGVVVAIANVAH
jgi:hypothetical protein